MQQLRFTTLQRSKVICYFNSNSIKSAVKSRPNVKVNASTLKAKVQTFEAKGFKSMPRA